MSAGVPEGQVGAACSALPRKASACVNRGVDAGLSRREENCSYRCGRLSTAVAIEVGPVCFQPFARTLHAAADLARQLPETRTVIHFPQVRNLVRDHVIHHVTRREDQAPGEGQYAVGSAAAPPALGVAQNDALHALAELLGLGPR